MGSEDHLQQWRSNFDVIDNASNKGNMYQPKYAIYNNAIAAFLSCSNSVTFVAHGYEIIKEERSFTHLPCIRSELPQGFVA